MVRDTKKRVGETWYRYVISSVHLVGVIEDMSNTF